jgi:dimeric dUTPase (all-alpha-NTP-PPase superfamily)
MASAAIANTIAHFRRFEVMGRGWRFHTSGQAGIPPRLGSPRHRLHWMFDVECWLLDVLPVSPFRLASPLRRRNAPRMEKPDQLRELFRMQRALNERIGVQMDGMNEEEKTKWLLNYTRAMQQELAELTDSVPWKWWAKYQKFDEQNARVEVVDLFHFLISMAQILGMSADDVFAAYVKKNEVNFKRQETGYAIKDHDDSKHI